MALIISRDSLSGEQPPRCIARTIQSKNEVIIDALPYIDKEYENDNFKDIVERLIEEEMEGFEPEDYLSSLPRMPSLSLPQDSLIRSEFDRLSAAPTSRMTPVDMSRYTVVAPSGKDSENLECWREAVKIAQTAQEYAAIRTSNLDLMNQFGVNAWRAYNSALEDKNALLKKEVATLDAQILAVNRKRCMEQLAAGEKVRRAEERYGDVRDKNLRLARLCEELEASLA